MEKPRKPIGISLSSGPASCEPLEICKNWEEKNTNLDTLGDGLSRVKGVKLLKGYRVSLLIRSEACFV